MQTNAQYAIVISVPLDQCINEQSDIQTVFSIEDAELVKEKLNKGEKCFIFTSSNVIATRPDLKTKKHSENILLYPLGNSPMDKLLAKADQNTCVIFYSYYSPCVKTCIEGKDNILDGLSNWINKRKEGMNIFVFEKIWQKDSNKNLKEQFLKINKIVDLYRCKTIGDVMKCVKCVENGIVDRFCLSDKDDDQTVEC